MAMIDGFLGSLRGFLLLRGKTSSDSGGKRPTQIIRDSIACVGSASSDVVKFDRLALHDASACILGERGVPSSNFRVRPADFLSDVFP